MARNTWRSAIVELLLILAVLSIAYVTVADDVLDSHLATGEFGPALQLAEQQLDQTARDHALARVAAAQAEAGGHAASLDTIARISDDRSRYTALQMVQLESTPEAGAEGGVQADFDSLMGLITSTVAPTSWEDVGGNGTVAPFAGGVFIDADGLLKRVERKSSTSLVALVAAERPSAGKDETNDFDASRTSSLRKISLPRLERAVQLQLAAGRQPTEEMQLLAGLEKIRYVLVYPETGDLVIAGPAADWKANNEGRMVSAESGRPVLHLDDLIVIWRHLHGTAGNTFGCSITPTQEGLARTREFAEASSKTPLKAGGRDAWLASLRKKLGTQAIDVFGIDPRTRVGQVLVEADYRMKLVGMGLEEGTVGVTSYLDSIEVARGESPPPMDVLRWWFTMNYKSLFTTPARDGYELRGQGVRVQCENEMINREGDRIHTGGASVLNQQFAQSFTEHFAKLAKKYPLYADMQNLFDLALVAALSHSEGLAEQANWHALCFGNPEAYTVAVGPTPRRVDTVMNHRVVNEKFVVVGVSGGVRVDPWKLVQASAIEKDEYGKLKAEQATGKPAKDLDRSRWWWD